MVCRRGVKDARNQGAKVTGQLRRVQKWTEKVD